MRKYLLAIFLPANSVRFVGARDVAPLPPSQLYGELFERVQTERLFPGQQDFRRRVGEVVSRTKSCVATRPGRIAQDSRCEHSSTKTSPFPAPAGGDFVTAPREEIRVHVDRLWAALTREPRDIPGVDSLLPLTTRYVVPGGRFRELYYWDSYFTMVGLQTSGRHDLVADMIENFAGLIDRYGHIPNGARSYQLSRSQPPFFAAMVTLQAEQAGERRA